MDTTHVTNVPLSVSSSYYIILTLNWSQMSWICNDINGKEKSWKSFNFQLSMRVMRKWILNVEMVVDQFSAWPAVSVLSLFLVCRWDRSDGKLLQNHQALVVTSGHSVKSFFPHSLTHIFMFFLIQSLSICCFACVRCLFHQLSLGIRLCVHLCALFSRGIKNCASIDWCVLFLLLDLSSDPELVWLIHINIDLYLTHSLWPDALYWTCAFYGLNSPFLHQYLLFIR